MVCHYGSFVSTPVFAEHSIFVAFYYGLSAMIACYRGIAFIVYYC